MESSRIDSKDNPPPPGGNDAGDGGSFPSTQQHRQRDSSSKSSIADHVADILPAIFNRSNAPGSPSDPLVSANSDPLFFNASENSEDFTYVPKKGFGMQKKGDKFHGFTYSCVPNTPRSVAMFGPLIKAASTADDAEVVTYDIYKLANVLVAAFSDLVLNANNDDITSYLYLTDFAVHALSDDVRKTLEELKQGFEKDGGIALALVTDLVATSNGDTLYERAVEPRDDSARSLTGIEALNEANLIKVYSALSAKGQTMAVLMANGVNTEADWVKKLVEKVPTLDELIAMKFGDMQSYINGTYVSGTGQPSGRSYRADSNDEVRASAHEMDVIHRMYAGMIGTARNVRAPPVRKNILESGLTLEVSEQLEEMGHYDLTELENASIYQVAKETSEAMESKGTLNMAFKVSERYSASNARKLGGLPKTTLATFTNKLVSAKQYGLKAAKSGAKKINSKKRVPIGSLIKGKNKSEQGEESSTSPAEKEEEEPASTEEGSAKGGLASLAKGAEKLSSALGGSGGIAGLAAGGPVTAALAIAPAALEVASALQEIVDEREAELKEEIKATEDRKEKIANEVKELLNSLGPNLTGDNVKEQKEKVEKLLASVRKPANFGVGPMQGMALAAMVESMSTKFSDTDKTALQPYKTNEDIAASVYGGNALKGVCIFMDGIDSISLPTATLLQKPKYVVMAGPAIPCRTTTVRLTSEKAMSSFINSTINSSFSAAEKSKTTSSSSNSSTASTLLVSANVTDASANESEVIDGHSGSELQGANDKAEEKGTEACVCEFCFMPMKTFRLSEGGLMLSEYAYHKLIGVTNALTAIEFLKSFGSHIPIGNQTLGGIFIRTMKMTSRVETKMSELYSAATVELSKVNREASMSSSSSGFSFGFITSAEVTTSASASSATSSEFTTTTEEAEGSGTINVTSTATFESNVICHGPNAATPDSFYKQLMTNNATWTIIDRDEPGSYLAIWDLIEYLGDGQYFGQQCDLLRAEWKRKALENLQRNPGDVELLADLWTFGSFEPVLEVSNFLLRLAHCLIPEVGPFASDSSIAKQFEDVVKAAANITDKSASASLAFGSPKEFIEAGAQAAPSVEKLYFKVCEDCREYEIAKSLMLSFNSIHWKSFDLAFTEAVTDAVASIEKSDRLVKLSKYYFDTDQKNWKLCIELIRYASKLHGNTREKVETSPAPRLEGHLEIRDKDRLACAHYLTKSNNFELFKQAIMLGLESIIPYGEEDDIVDYVHAHGNDEMKNFIDSITLVDVANDITITHSDGKATHTIKLAGSFEIDRVIPVNRYSDESAISISVIEVFQGKGIIWRKSFGNRKFGIGEYILLDHGVVGDAIVIHSQTSSEKSEPINAQVLTRSLRNVALGKKATQSSTDSDFDASRAVDGSLLHYPCGSRTTNEEKQEGNLHWWEVDLEGTADTVSLIKKTFDIYAIKIYAQRDKKSWHQFNNFTVEVFSDDRKTKSCVPVWSKCHKGALEKKDYTFKIPHGVEGNRVRISTTRYGLERSSIIAMNEVQVFAKSGTYMAKSVVSNFLLHLATCLFPVGSGVSSIGGQFETVAKKAAAEITRNEPGMECTSVVEFIQTGAAAVTEDLQFTVVQLFSPPGCEDIAESLMSSFKPIHWSNFDSAFKDSVKQAADLGKRDRLVKLCKRYFDTDEEDWSFCSGFILAAEYDIADVNDKEAYIRHLKEQFKARDEFGLTCAHYLTKSDDFVSFKRAIVLGPDSIIPHGDEDDIMDFVDAHAQDNEEMREFIYSNTLVDVANDWTSIEDGTVIETKLGGSFEINFLVPINPSSDDPSTSVTVKKVQVFQDKEKIREKSFGDGQSFGGGDSIKFGGVVGNVVKVFTASETDVKPQVWTRSLRNVALGKEAKQSSTMEFDGVTYDASRAVDGNRVYGGLIVGAMTDLNKAEHDHWWEVDLDGTYDIYAIRILPPGSSTNWYYHFNDFTVKVFNHVEEVWSTSLESPPADLEGGWYEGFDFTFKIPPGRGKEGIWGGRVKISAGPGEEIAIMLNEVQVFAKGGKKVEEVADGSEEVTDG